jgi:hypothetical protein
LVIAAATETPRGERSHAIRAHIAKDHWAADARTRLALSVISGSCLEWSLSVHSGQIAEFIGDPG